MLEFPGYKRIFPATAGLALRGAALLTLIIALPACQTKGPSRALFEPRLTPEEYMLVAVSDADADLRREAVAAVAAGNARDRDWAIEGFATIALLDSDPQARCVALRALGASCDPRATDACIAVLTYQNQPPGKIRTPSAICRWDAAEALAAQAQRECIAADRRTAARDALLDRLERDPDRQVRLTAARGLGAFSDVTVVEALIAGLADPDFGVVYACEDSLVRLTGVTHHCDPFAWQGWLESHRSAPFANAGAIPDSRRPPYDNEWQRRWRETRGTVERVLPRRERSRK